ncbi:40S ribosomal protein S17 [Linum grandiflorum]
MGRVRTKTVKKSSRQVIERYYSKMTLDFHTNKKILEEVAIIPSKRLRNKIAGFSTHLMKRIQKGPVRGMADIGGLEEIDPVAVSAPPFGFGRGAGRPRY